MSQAKELALIMADLEHAGADELTAFDNLMARHQRQVLMTALRLLGNMEDARDAAQEVFYRLYKYRGRFNPSRELAPWLYRMTVNVCFDLRRKRPYLPLAEVDEPSSPAVQDAEVDLAARREIVKEALRRLPDRERAALVLREIEGLSTHEVAEILGIAEVTVRSQVSTAKAKLRDICAGLMRRPK